MKSVLRIGILLCVVLLVTSGLVQAQTDTKTYCGDLKAADCTLLTESEAATKALESHSFKLDMTLDVSGLPDMPSDKLSFKLTGSGATAVDQKSMPDMSKFDPSTLSKDPKAIFDLLAKVIPSVSADLEFSLTIPTELTKDMKNTKLPNPLKLHVKLVEGIAYVNVGDFADVVPQLKGAKGWMGMSLPDLMTAVMKQPQFHMNMGGMSSSMAMSADMTKLFSDPKTFATFIKIERLADSEVGSRKVAVFKTTLDYPAMFAMPAVQEMILQQATAAGAKLTEKDKTMILDQIQLMAKGMEFSSTQSIDLENKYVLETSINMKLDFSSMKPMMGSAPVITLQGTVTQADFNSVPTITAPEGALVLPVDTVMPSKK